MYLFKANTSQPKEQPRVRTRRRINQGHSHTTPLSREDIPSMSEDWRDDEESNVRIWDGNGFHNQAKLTTTDLLWISVR